MLFSDPAVAAFVRDHFVAAWQSVRPVPTLDIDFGNGRTLRRTVTGNIATYVCSPNGRVIDIIPGLSDPASFLDDLQRALDIYRRSRESLDEAVLIHHRSAPVETDAAEPPALRPSAGALETLAAFALINRRERKPLVHALLAEEATTPALIYKRLFRDVLGLDLDDPYLGLLDEKFDGGPYGHP